MRIRDESKGIKLSRAIEAPLKGSEKKRERRRLTNVRSDRDEKQMANAHMA